MAELPSNRIATTFFDGDRCAVCGREWEARTTPVPTVYTDASITAVLPPQPIGDLCVEEHDPEVFNALLEDRERFWAS